jgi:uncharacterized membrane protein
MGYIEGARFRCLSTVPLRRIGPHQRAPVVAGHQSREELEPSVKTLLKTLSWRTIGIVEMFAVTYFTTGKMAAAVTVAAISFFAKGAMYYGHEIAWEKAWK